MYTQFPTMPRTWLGKTVVRSVFLVQVQFSFGGESGKNKQLTTSGSSGIIMSYWVPPP